MIQKKNTLNDEHIVRQMYFMYEGVQLDTSSEPTIFAC
ncbi:hypothetical protein T03_4936 [Trichinella britovi]|uniref:Uncharacterized protein n=1 Tax=Trichinella britovi TaxID=45882 RepID=A0A0V1DHN8_TRIBR|nr:hypothetical protein T03_4936 [Trichinella britovi]